MASLGAVAIRAAGAVCGFLFNVALARTLGAPGTGSVMLYLSFATMIGLIATGGMDVVGLRELSRSAAERERTNAMLANLACGALASMLLFSIGSFVFLLMLRPSLGGIGSVWVYAICALMLCTTALQKTLSDWLVGLGELAASQLTFYFLNRIAALSLVLAGLAIGVSASAQSFMTIYAAGLLVCVLYAVWRISTHITGGVPSPRLAAVTPLLHDGISCAAQNAAFILLNFAPFLLLGLFSTASETGLFGVSQRLVALVVLTLTTVSQLAMRDFSRAFADRDSSALARALTASFRLTFLAAIGLTLPLVLCAPFWISVFGPPFAAAAPTLVLLSAGVCAQCLGMPFQAVLLTTHHERGARNVTVVCAAAGIALNVLLVPHWGALGAAMGTGIGLALQSAGHAIYAFRALPLRFHAAFFAIVPLPATQSVP
ncbi:MAG TPA: polysaccharide biosynthesis C-terminal domain-containing protein [Bryobacteraceae bacterium]|jgi:O-antigen/teichoic acid export membrane protein